MTVEYGKVEHTFTLSDELELYGTATKDVIVAANGALYLYGTIGGDLRVETGGKAFVDGAVVGAVINDGGLVKIEGSVGDVVERSGTTRVSPEAQVNGQPYGRRGV